MAQSLQARVAGRGFPVWDQSGQSGQGALPDSTAPGAPGVFAGAPSGTWADPNADPGASVTGLGPPADFTSEGLWGLSGSLNPDKTPRTHAAPAADPTLPIGLYYEEADAAHAFDQGGPDERRNVGTLVERSLDHVTADNGTGSNQQALTGQIRALAQFDAVQGYGGGGDGPGGVNATMPLHTDQKNYPGTLYNTQTFVSAAEVPFLVAEADQFIATDPYLQPWRGGLYDGPTATVLAQDSFAEDVPATGSPVPSAPAQSVSAYAGSFW